MSQGGRLPTHAAKCLLRSGVFGVSREAGGSGILRTSCEAMQFRSLAHDVNTKESADKPGSVVDSHSSRPCVAAWLKQPTRERCGPHRCSPIRSCSRWGLPCRAALAPRAVRSYRTVSPSPRTSRDAVRLSVLCCTVRRLTPPRRYLAPCPVEPGLSSKHLRASRLSGRLRNHFSATEDQIAEKYCAQ